MTDLSTAIAAISESATLAIDAKFKKFKEQGLDVIGFAAGEPDFATPANVVEAAVEACRDPKNHHYTPAAGLPELREAIALKTKRDSGYTVDASQIIVTNGGKHALMNAFTAIIDPGDEVILPTPYWTSYPEQIHLCGGKTINVVAGAENNFRVTVEQLDAAYTPKTKALVFCSPSNPTGTVYSEAEVEAIGRWALRKGIWVIADEIYEHLVYGNAQRSSMPVVVNELAAKTIVVNGVAKSYAMTGWRIGWVIAPIAIARAIANLQSHQTSNVANVSQRAAIEAITGHQAFVAEMRDAFDRRRGVIHWLLNTIDGFECPEPEGAFYAYPSVQGVIGKTINAVKIDSSKTLADVILNHAGVACVPGEAFGTPGYLRFSYALSDHDLQRGLERVISLVAGEPVDFNPAG